MQYSDLRDFIKGLEQRGELKRIQTPVSPVLEMTEICDRTLRKGGPALLFENPTGSDMPVLGNLFGTPERVAMGMGAESISELREIGKLLAFLKEPDPPKGLKDAWSKLPIFKKVINMAPKVLRDAPCQAQVFEGDDVDLGRIPVQTCWPGDAGPLITWGLVVTKGPHKERQNLGIYRQQVIGRNKVIMRWLSHRGGALDFREWQEKHPGEPFPVAVVLGADPATILGAVTPVPDSLSEYAFAGLLRGQRTELVKCRGSDLQVPASAEIVLEGVIHPGEMAAEGPFGDHTGYYNEVDRFPVFTIERITQREKPIYHSTYTGRPPDEPAVLGVALNEVFVPLLQKQFPEITDFYLPPEGCSYRMAVVSMKKQYPGHAKRVMLGVWSFLRQFMYTKYVIVVDEDINIRDWHDIIWAITTRMDPKRDTVMIDNTPIDYLDFASPVSGLGSKMGLDATNKWPGETTREWGVAIEQDAAVRQRVDAIWAELGIDQMRVALEPGDLSLEIDQGETILAAARRQGFDAPNSCRNGNCHVCTAVLLKGRVSLPGDREGQAGDEIYTCVATPLEDCTLHWEGVLAPGQLPVRSLACQVAECSPIGGDVWRVRLRTPAGKPLRYYAGQYLLLEREGAEPAAFSIASAPGEERMIELHILTRDPLTQAVIDYLQHHRIARVQVPFGDACLTAAPTQPLVLIAAGTGLAQMQSIIEDCLQQGVTQPIHLYWGVRHSDDLYNAPHWQRWEQAPNLYLHRVVSDQADWSRRQGLLHQAVCEDLTDLADYRFVVSGSPGMVYATLDALVAAGMPEQQMQADAFAYAPR